MSDEPRMVNVPLYCPSCGHDLDLNRSATVLGYRAVCGSCGYVNNYIAHRKGTEGEGNGSGQINPQGETVAEAASGETATGPSPDVCVWTEWMISAMWKANCNGEMDMVDLKRGPQTMEVLPPLRQTHSH